MTSSSVHSATGVGTGTGLPSSVSPEYTTYSRSISWVPGRISPRGGRRSTHSSPPRRTRKVKFEWPPRREISIDASDGPKRSSRNRRSPSRGTIWSISLMLPR